MADEPFVISVTDKDSGRPVPMVSLTTTHHVEYITDNLGVAAIDEPELIGREVFFRVNSHGYQFPKDGFGMVGKRFKLTSGGRGQLEVERVNIAERLYRITGGGRFHHSQRVGLEIPEFRRDLRAGVFGCDSVLNAVFDDTLFWIWGDTNRPKYPLGNFQSTGAVSKLPWDPEKGVDLEYFDDGKGFVKPMAAMPGDGPTWLTGLTVLLDKDGNEHLGAMYQKVKGHLQIYETGLCEFDRKTERFEKLFAFEDGQGSKHMGHPFPYQDEKGESWMVYADPLPTMKIPMNYESWIDPSTYIPLEVTSEFKDPVTGDPVKPHRGSIAWNGYRKKWTMIFGETKSEKKEPKPSRLGEIWYAESESPFGPWNRCVKVLTHDRYSFYNPKQHPYFAKEGGRVIYFEGTYTTSFSKAPVKTPRYDYNQILYCLDLDDERFAVFE